jgi:hypothetical protein
MPESEPSRGGAYALLTATGRYSDPTLGQLRAPTRDAEELAKVLRDPAIGGFTVSTLVNKPDHLVRETIEGFFADRSLNDLLVFYASCHGVKDPSGRLYFAATTTKVSRLASTGISAEFLFEQVDRCRAQKILVLLDCCYSGSYAKGHLPRSGDRIEIGLHEGRGRAAISSSTTQEYSFEITTGKVTGTASPSVFTAALVKGLGTGAADIDGDGLVSVDDLYTYVRNEIRAVTPYQTPEKKWGDVRGDFVIARNPNPPAPQPEQPPIDVRRAVWSDPASSPAGNVMVEATAAHTRFWSLTSYLAVSTVLGGIATLLILGFARGNTIRVNALLALEIWVICGAGLALTIVGASHARQNAALGVGTLIPGVLLLVACLIMLIFCVARVWRYRQPDIPFLTKAAQWVVYGKSGGDSRGVQ